MRFVIFILCCIVMAGGIARPLAAQGTAVELGALRQDTTLPVEVGADRLAVDQSDGTAVFSGNVTITQGELKLTAGEVRVVYAEATDGGQGAIERLEATGGVTLVTSAEAAEAAEAVYSIASGEIVMTGDVVLTQGRNALSSQKLTVNFTDGTGVLEGGVRTTLQPGGGP